MTNNYDFTKLVFATAWEDTKAFYRNKARTIIVGVLSFAVGVFVYYKIAGWEKVVDEILITGAFILAPFTLFAILLYLWNLMITPLKLVYESSQQTQALIKITPKAAKGPTLEQTAAKKGPDYSQWDLADKFEIGELSKLLGGQKTSERKYSDSANAWYRVLDVAIENGKLRYSRNSIHKRIIDRQDLITFFINKKTKHPLLHPELRKRNKRKRGY